MDINDLIDAMRSPATREAAANFFGFLARPAKVASAYLGNTPEGTLSPGFWGPEADKQWMQDQALGLAGPTGIKGIRAFHGSPHDFNKFDLSKIGTGEGAQGRGYGLYFAENPKVAELYKEPNSINGVLPGGPGHMYEVNIKADPNKMLNLDQPLAPQIPRQILEGEALKLYGMKLDDLNPSAQEFLAKRLLQRPRTVAQLNESGVPGSRFLDEGSRSAGSGTSNYVVYNPNIIDIIRKFLIAGGLGSALGMGVDNQPAQAAPR